MLRTKTKTVSHRATKTQRKTKEKFHHRKAQIKTKTIMIHLRKARITGNKPLTLVTSNFSSL